MNDLNYKDYYTHRAAESQRLADKAINQAVAAIHRDFAARYSAKAERAQRGERLADG